jgi:hypothetical protein
MVRAESRIQNPGARMEGAGARIQNPESRIEGAGAEIQKSESGMGCMSLSPGSWLLDSGFFSKGDKS